MKDDENNRLKLDWNLQRTLAKVNYTIHTDAIKENLIPEKLSKQQISYVYASEADLLNMALFAMTAADWRSHNKLKEISVTPLIWSNWSYSPILKVSMPPYTTKD